MKKPIQTIVIIGGGISGLSAGIYAQMHGFQTTILEKNRVVGGQCTGWNRNGYHIDGCIHWLTGTKEGSDMHQLWNEVGALEGVEIHHPHTFLTFEKDGERASIYRNLNLIEHKWIDLFPQDAPFIKEFCQDVKRLQGFAFPVEKPMDLMGLKEKITTVLSMKEAGAILKKYGKMTIQEFGERFQSPVLQEGFRSMAPPHYNAAMIFFAIAAFTSDEASIPLGGSYALADRMRQKYLSLGGTIELGCEVTDINLKQRRVSSISDAKGRVYKGDYFIASCDAHHLFHTLLKGSYNDPQFEKRFSNPKSYPLASEILVALGFSGTMEELGESETWSLTFPITPIKAGAHQVERLLIKHFSHEPSFAPQGNTLLVCDINQYEKDYDYWASITDTTYKEEKARIGDEVKKALIQRYPAMANRLTVLDVVTPKTYERYCNAYRGSFMAFFPTTTGKMMSHTGAIKNIKNLVLSSQWIQPPGGLPTALTSGRNAIMRLCKKEHIAWKCR